MIGFCSSEQLIGARPHVLAGHEDIGLISVRVLERLGKAVILVILAARILVRPVLKAVAGSVENQVVGKGLGVESD